MRSLERIVALLPCCLSVWLSVLSVYCWIVQCSGHPDTRASSPIPSRHFLVPSEKAVGMEVQSRRDISRTVENRGQVTIEC